ncbi:MAG: hypothetical protein RKH07_04605 [Gammaproteobacteria bacterium]
MCNNYHLPPSIPTIIDTGIQRALALSIAGLVFILIVPLVILTATQARLPGRMAGVMTTVAETLNIEALESEECA